MESQVNPESQNAQQTRQNPTTQVSPIPEEQTSSFLLHKKLGKKTLIFIVVLTLSVSVGFFIKSYFTGKQSRNTLRQKVIITDNEWKNIKNKISDGYVYRYFKQQLKEEPRVFSDQPRSNAEKFFVSAHKYTDIPPGSVTNSVLGEATDSGSLDRELETSLVKIRLSGAINNDETSKVDEYEIFMTNLTAQDKVNYGGVSDVLINGKIGKLQLGDPDFDALHLSIIEPNQSAAYIKASISDIFLIALDRMIYGPDPEATTSGVISAQYDDIYPYFDRYIEVVDEADSEELLPKELQAYLDRYSEFSYQSFQATVGDLDKYLERTESYTDTMTSEPIIRVETKVNTLAFFNQLKTFLIEVDKYAREKKEIYEQYCRNDSEEIQKDCLNYFGYVVKEDADYNFLLALAPLVKFDKFDIILDSDDKNFLGIDLNLSLNKTVFDFLKQTFPGEFDGLVKIENLNFQLTFRDMPTQKIEEIEKPTSYLHFLPNGSYLTIDKQVENDTEKLAKQLFLINHDYVYEVWEEDLEKLNQNKVGYCQEKWEPKFCLEIGNDWQENEFLTSSPNKVGFQYPSKYRGLKAKSISLEFINDQTITQGLSCDNRDYEDYEEVRTQDGLIFRINRLAKDELSQEFLQNEFVIDVCYQNPDGKFTTINPLSKSIGLSSQRMSFEEVSQKAGAILGSIKLQNLDQIDLSQGYSQAFEQYETFYLENAKDDPNACSVGFYRDQNSFSRNYENIKKDFSIKREFNNIVIEENTAFCQWDESSENKNSYCLKCVKGKLEWTELTDCKGLSCNP